MAWVNLTVLDTHTEGLTLQGIVGFISFAAVDAIPVVCSLGEWHGRVERVAQHEAIDSHSAFRYKEPCQIPLHRVLDVQFQILFCDGNIWYSCQQVDFSADACQKELLVVLVQRYHWVVAHLHTAACIDILKEIRQHMIQSHNLLVYEI